MHAVLSWMDDMRLWLRPHVDDKEQLKAPVPMWKVCCVWLQLKGDNAYSCTCTKIDSMSPAVRLKETEAQVVCEEHSVAILESVHVKHVSLSLSRIFLSTGHSRQVSTRQA